MRVTFGAVPLAMSLVFGSAAQAATVRTIDGNVLINRGGGYERVRGTSQAKVGDTVMASPDGAALIIYADGCTVTVRPGSVVSIAAQSSCKRSTPAHAATVRTIDGNVQINRGSGYERVRGTSQAKAGDTVMASPDGAAVIVYADGCAVSVRAGSVVSIASQSSCKRSTAVFPGRMGATKQDTGFFDCNEYPDHCMLGRAALVGARVGIYFLVKDDDEKPSSP